MCYYSRASRVRREWKRERDDAASRLEHTGSGPLREPDAGGWLLVLVRQPGGGPLRRLRARAVRAPSHPGRAAPTRPRVRQPPARSRLARAALAVSRRRHLVRDDGRPRLAWSRAGRAALPRRLRRTPGLGAVPRLPGSSRARADRGLAGHHAAGRRLGSGSMADGARLRPRPGGRVGRRRAAPHGAAPVRDRREPGQPGLGRRRHGRRRARPAHDRLAARPQGAGGADLDSDRLVTRGRSGRRPAPRRR